jgi:hypothetical protein
MGVWASESQLAFIMTVRHVFPASGMPRVQNDIPGGCLDAVFKVVVQKQAEIWTNCL